METFRRQLFLVIVYVACIAALSGCSRESDPVAPVDPYAHLLLDTFDCPQPFMNAGIEPRLPSTFHSHSGSLLIARGWR
jgi:hypothetical protein